MAYFRNVLVSVLCALFSASGYADFSEKERPHHFYNAELLEKHEFQVSIAGNVKFGLFETLEVGGNGLALLLGLPNLSLKHRMFERDGFKTAFSSHMFMLSGSAASSDSEDQEGEESGSGESEGTASTSVAFFGAIGVLTTHEVGNGGAFSWGLYDFLAFGKLPVVDVDISAHFLSPTVAYDFLLGKHFAITTALAYPVYMHGTLNSVAAQAELNTSTIGNEFGKIFMEGFATATYSTGIFNVEFGLAQIFSATRPYVNCFWRF